MRPDRRPRALRAFAAAFCLACAWPPAVSQAGPGGAASAAAAVPDLHLGPPSATPEAPGEHDDFPYLAPLPGSTLLGAEQAAQGLDVTTPDDDDAHIVGTHTLTRLYARPPGLGDDAWLRVYARALRDAGWTIMAQERRAGDGALLVAHYAAGGRDLWARLSTATDSYRMAVADVGEDLGHLLARACRATLYGIEFVADRPDLAGPAENILMEVQRVLRADRSIHVQVVVHLDPGDVPNDPAGARRLSQQRAEAVRTWLARHRIDADRVTAVGAGASHPLQLGDTEAQRARNRRVELVKDGCG